MTAFVPYVTFMKHAQKVAKGRAGKTRPILATVSHNDKHVAVTDSHRLYLATDIYSGNTKTVDAETGVTVGLGEYPDVERLVADSKDARYTHTMYVTSAYEAIRAIEIANRVNKMTSFIKLKVRDNNVEISTTGAAAFSVRYNSDTTEDSEDNTKIVTIEAKYFKEALHVLKDAKVDKFTLEYFGETRPLHIRAGNFLAVVMPVRATKGDK